MEQSIIEVSHLSKKYILVHRLPYETLRDKVIELTTWPFRLLQGRLSRAQKEEFWALKDINFTVEKGDAIGLIGPNGSGKSTLLKLLSQITAPNAGEIVLRGKVASLLEVGTGFHPELTGRENIYLNGAILGMTRKEITRKFDDIVEFSGVERFLDTPVKRFSSGMQVRLAFSVAAHMDPDILIVDEVLAVGDAEFQKKCLGKIDEVTKTAGRTVIFVSHNMEAIKKICTKCILLKTGRIEMMGDTNTVVEHYLHKTMQQSAIVPLSMRRDRQSKGNVWFTDIKITNQRGAHTITSGDGLRVVMKYDSEFREPISDVRIVVAIVNDDLQPVLWFDSEVPTRTFSTDLTPQGEIVCETEGVNLTEGQYFVHINFHIKGESQDVVMMATAIDVTTDPTRYGFAKDPDYAICDSLVAYHYSQPTSSKKP